MTPMKNRVDQRLFLFLIATSLLFGGSACETEHYKQKAQDIFADGQIPSLFRQLSNPSVDESQIHRTTEAKLKVAVIDNGVDYTHPDLINHIHFDRDSSGKISGAGLDLWALDSWASPNTIRPDVFAFGAKGVRNGKIVGAVDDPLLLLNKLNDQFLDVFFKNLNSNSDLKKSLFNKISRNNFTVFGAMKLIGSYLNGVSPFMTSLSGFSHSSAEKFSSSMAFDELSQFDWLIKDDGTPSFSDHLSKFQYSGLFMQILNQSLDEFDGATQFTSLLRNYAADLRMIENPGLTSRPYINFQLRHSLINSSEVGNLANTFNGLHHKNQKYMNGGIQRSISYYCAQLSEIEYAQFKKLSPQERLNRYLSFLEGGFQFSHRFMEYRHHKTKRHSKEEILLSRDHAQYILSNIRERFSGLSCNSVEMAQWDRQKDAYQQFYRDLNHPLYEGSSASRSHGTHVSGIITQQSKSVDIVPVKVITETPASEQDRDERITSLTDPQGFFRQFRTWLLKPAVFKGLQALVGKHIDTAELPYQGTSVGRVIYVSRFTSLVYQGFLDEYNNQRLDHYFFEDIVSAIKYVGQQKIKVANISLGADFSKSVDGYETVSQSQELGKIFNYLRFEFYKYQIAAAVQQYAPHTLFFVAAGNNGQWLDGNVRSGLPCDISSDYFAQYETEDSLVLNNHIKNVVCVGSMSRRNELSSFTNIPISPVPYVISFGESIYSTIKTTDCSGPEQWFDLNFGTSLNLPDDDKEFRNYVHSIEKWKPSESERIEHDRLDSLWKKYRIFGHVASNSAQFSRTQTCIGGSQQSGHMSGTSMASPTVAGYFARKIAEEMHLLNLNNDEIYAHPDFAPQKIVDRILAHSPTYGGQSILKDAKKITDIRFKTVEPYQGKNTPPTTTQEEPEIYFLK